MENAETRLKLTPQTVPSEAGTTIAAEVAMVPPDLIRQIKTLSLEGFVDEDERGHLRVTPLGAPLLDSIVADLAA